MRDKYITVHINIYMDVYCVWLLYIACAREEGGRVCVLRGEGGDATETTVLRIE